jgi:hypothetical protein
MRTLLLTSFSALLCCVISLVSLEQAASNPSGAPGGVTGSPSDGQTCWKSDCHSGAAPVAQAGLISTNIPADGYLAGATYTITISISELGISRWGFEASPQSSSGTLMGTPVITNSTETKIVSTKYVTHRTAGNSGSNGKTWSFDWIAPAAGSGVVNFYTCVMASNDSGDEIGDHGYTNVLSIQEAIATGISSLQTASIEFFPNPCLGDYVNYKNLQEDIRLISLFSLSGSLLTSFKPSSLQGKLHVAELPAGVYFVVISTANATRTMRWIRN